MADVLKGKVAVVTGGGRGIGAGIARLFAQEGAKVVVGDAGVSVSGTGGERGPADEVVAQVRKAGGDAIACYENVATMQGGENLVKAALDHFGRLDIVVTCAGILRDRMVFNMTEEDWDAVIAVHLKGTFSVVKPASIIFRQQRSGRVITFSSESGLVGNSGQANYGAAKSGIGGFTKVVARDLGRYGATVNCIAPRARTRMTEAVPQAARQLRTQRGIAGIEEDDGLTAWPPECIAPFATYLASDYASDVNGQFFVVYGTTIALMSQPRLIRTLFKPQGYWELDELRKLLPHTLAKGLVNPAPPQPAR